MRNIKDHLNSNSGITSKMHVNIAIFHTYFSEALPEALIFVTDSGGLKWLSMA